MLLRHLYDLAHSRQLLDDLAFTPKAIRWVITLDADGNLTAAGPQETTGAKNRGKEFSAPQTSRPKVAGGVAEFLADGITAVFGLDSDPEKDADNVKRRQDRDANNAAKYEDFWRQIEQAYQATQHQMLKALLQFRTRTGQTPTFLRWEAKPGEKPAWWMTDATSKELRLGPEQFTFEVNGELLLHDEQTLRPYWRTVFQQESAARDADSKPGLCLITGASNVPIAATHTPKIKASILQSFGAAIISFDKPAFASYGFDQSYNAPTSVEAATAYCVALNWLLNQKNHSLRVGQAAVCFWAQASEEATDFLAAMLDRPQPEQVRDFLAAPWAGVDRQLLQHEQFYSVTLSGNAGRVVVRHWLQSTVAAARENLRQWFADLAITPYGDPTAREKRKAKEAGEGDKTKEAPQPLALYSLAVTTVREAKDLQAETLTQLYRAALEGVAPPLLLLKPLLSRWQKELVREGPKALFSLSRFALMRLILNRNRKEGEPMIEPQVFDTNDAAYNCGRLLAIFDDLQMKAHEYQLEGAGVVERYYGSASSAPNSAFGILWRLHQHHLKKVSRQGDKGKAAAEGIKRRIAEIACRFPQPAPQQPPTFPRTFSLQEQGRFALGFYQQKAADDAARRAARPANNSTNQPAVNTPSSIQPGGNNEQ